jgi:ankyrin repeat domain-containing protein 50
MASQDKNSNEIICILDAFDECEDQGQSDFTQALCRFYGTRNHSNLKFLLTSRPYGKIRRGFQPLDILGLPVIHLSGESEIEVEKIAREIDVFIRARTRSIQGILKLDGDEEKLLLQELMRVPNRTYLWAHLTLELVQSDIDIDKTRIRKATSHLPQTVDEAYERILNRSRNFEEAKRLLHFVVAATRPLTLAEMDLVLNLRKNHRSYKDLNPKPEDRFREHVRDLCGLFVTIIGSRIYLLHQTAREFLVQGPANTKSDDKTRFKWKFSLQPRESHRVLSQVCIQHLLFSEFDDLPFTEFHDLPFLTFNHTPLLPKNLEDHIFLDYSAKNWPIHYRESNINDGKSILKICNARSYRCRTWFWIYWRSKYRENPRNFTSLMIASYFRLAQAVKLLLKDDIYDIDSVDLVYRRSALSWASENGFDNVGKLLTKRSRLNIQIFVNRGANVNREDVFGRTPTSYAIWNGHVAVVKLLLSAGANVDLADEIGGTPMSYAVCSGNRAITGLISSFTTQKYLDVYRRQALLVCVCVCKVCRFGRAWSPYPAAIPNIVAKYNRQIAYT